MFDVGFWELALIFMLGLMVLGPEKLPRIAAQVGRWVGRARRTATQLRYQLEREINIDERPHKPYTPPPKTSQIVPPPGAQRDEPGAAPEAASEAAEAADAAEAAKSSEGGSHEPERGSDT